MNIKTYDMAFEEDNIWFVHYKFNILFCFNITVGQVVKTIPIPVEVADYNGPYFIAIIYNKGKIYLMPWNEGNLFIYDIGDDSYESIKVPLERIPYATGFFFNHDDLYIVPCASTEILKLNHINNQLDKVVDLKNYISNTWTYGGSVEHMENGVYAISMVNSSEILIFDSNEEKVSKISIVDDEIGESRIVYVKPYIYMSTSGKNRSKVRIINPKTGEVIKEIEKKNNNNSEIWSVFDKYILIDYDELKIYDIYDYKLNYIGEMNYLDYENELHKPVELTRGIWKQNHVGVTALFNNCDCSISIFKDGSFENKETFCLKGDEAVIKRVLKEHMTHGLREADDYKLQDMLDIIIEK